MRHRKSILFVLFIAFTLTALGQQATQDHKILFEKAKFTMETKGDLKGAITLFGDLIKKYPKEREYAAKSQLFIGECYEKLGNAQAHDAYESVIKNYSDQSEIVSQAQKKLSVMSGPGKSEGLTTRRIIEKAGYYTEYLSPDGKYICHLEPKTGDMLQYDVASGQTNRIVNIGSQEAKTSNGDNQIFSRDGKKIAYMVYGNSEKANELLIRNLDGTDLRTIYGEMGYEAIPMDWSPDNKSILVWHGKDKIKNLALISIADGSVQKMRAIPSDWVDAKFSPDGKYIAFSCAGDAPKINSDLFLISIDGLRETKVAPHTSEDQLLQWTADGKNLLFFSDRSGTWDLWKVPISNGKQKSEPELLKSGIGHSSEIIGYAPNGSLYYKTFTMLGHLYFGSLDPLTRKMTEAAVMVNTKFASPAQQLRWSPDGKKLAYLSNMGRVGPGRNILTIWSPDSGEERFLTPNLRGVNQISWATDSRNIIALGFTEVGTGTYLIDTETSDIKRLNDGCVFPYIGPNGKTVIHWKNGMIQNLNLETGNEVEIVKTNSICPQCYDLSPDGKQVVFQVKGSIQTISTDGGEAHEIFSSPANISMLKWANDGKNIVIGFMRNKESEVWLIPEKEGTPQKLEISIPRMNYFVLHPDNRHFAYSIMEGVTVEMWVLENFLPK